MATGQQAILRIAEATGRTYPSVYRAARELREADGDLWPTSKRGPQKHPVHVKVHHLSNLIIALSTPDQSLREQSVREYRAMVILNREDILFDQSYSPDFLPLKAQGSFGAALDYLIEHLDDFSPQLGGLAPSGPIQVWLWAGSLTNAGIGFERRGVGVIWHSPSEIAGPDSAIRVSGTIPFSLLKILAELAAHGRAQENASSLSGSSAPTTAGSGNENAAPGRAAPRRPRKRVATAEGQSGPATTLTLSGREKQHAVLGHPQMGALPFGVSSYEQHASFPSSA